jgi:redox-sensitive bicupin YhaK (pirin superfamily)
VNLPAADKMTAPRYQDIAPERIPEVESVGANVRVVAGSYGGVTGPVNGIATEPLYLDVKLDAGTRFETAVASSHNAFVYVYDGAARIGDAALGRGDLAVLTAGDQISVEATEPAAFLVVAGKPLGESVARYGPIVMNTRAELERAFEDLREGRF